MTAFVNTSALDLRRPAVRDEAQAAVAELDRRLPVAAPVRVGEELRESEELVSADPGKLDRAVAVAAVATAAEVDRAVRLAAGPGREGWGSRTASERATVLERAAGSLQERRLELAALAVRECAKPWREADGDVCEAIDFLRYYAAQAIDLERGRPVASLPGEANSMAYHPLGVAAVIAPWNFPLAILCGMTAGALAAGNCVVMKPAEQAPGCGAALAEVLLGAGVPAAALSVVHGAAETGGCLVEHPLVDVIAFTGSQSVGATIIERASRLAPGQTHFKRVIAELGGKNCAYVDSDADLDDAIPALMAGSFGFAGQKCSATSRIIVHGSRHDEFVDRMAGAVAVLNVGQADRLETDVPPLIDRDAKERLEAAAERAAAEGRVLAKAPAPIDDGWFVEPALVGELPDSSPLLDTELFGPLVTVESVADTDEALARIDALPFGLTGGVFSRNPTTIRRFARETPVGNLYVNRGMTGAMVGRQPFGGNRLSGTGAKAGGPDYLLGFVEPRVVTERTVRHGLIV
ncbi:MAG TPA: aldehyde dehydrogenase family protein [Solirubrobacterales bacterium]|jgi:RHH-type proline utilization regulon transcriptional repressor/proline dehydrogenase/delta 1-pyrroline-5-carboxylate dehydrogenase|nr:aldehyde dehydrogenase family protein [Solirubrobacterales bacterium]